jgi:thiol-disulfide isomerase/thioredoxin
MPLLAATLTASLLIANPSTSAGSPPSSVIPVALADGAAAPGFSLTDAAGKTVKLSDLKGKVVVVEFWATWCGPCMASLPILAEVTKAAGSDVVLLAVNIDDSETVAQIRAALERRKLTVRALTRGSATARSFGVGAIPHTVVIDPRGRIAATHVGVANATAYRDRIAADIRTAKARK